MPMQWNVEEIGPREAKKLLSKLMPNYRHADPKWVTRFAKGMETGKWLESAETIKVDDELGLIDGRRRLLAVVESGCTVKFLVMRGKFEPFKLGQD